MLSCPSLSVSLDHFPCYSCFCSVLSFSLFISIPPSPPYFTPALSQHTRGTAPPQHNSFWSSGTLNKEESLLPSGLSHLRRWEGASVLAFAAFFLLKLAVVVFCRKVIHQVGLYSTSFSTLPMAMVLPTKGKEINHDDIPPREANTVHNPTFVSEGKPSQLRVVLEGLHADNVLGTEPDDGDLVLLNVPERGRQHLRLET